MYIIILHFIYRIHTCNLLTYIKSVPRSRRVYFSIHVTCNYVDIGFNEKNQQWFFFFSFARDYVKHKTTKFQ